MAGSVLLVSTVSTIVLATSAWYLLPYEALELESASDRFHAWEATMWMIGLALILFGIAAGFGATDLSVQHGGDPTVSRAAEHIQDQAGRSRRGIRSFAGISAAPWLMLGSGMGMLLAAALMRSVLGGAAGGP